MPNCDNDPLLEMFIFETNQLLSKLEEIILDSEKNHNFLANIDEIFRIMHTIKGNSAMMIFDNISNLAHSIEDLFDYIRKNKQIEINYTEFTDLVLESKDFIKAEIEKIQNNQEPDGDAKALIDCVEKKLRCIKEQNNQEQENSVNEKAASELNQKFYISSKNEINSHQTKDKLISYEILIKFIDGCQMENVRAFTVIHNINDIVTDIRYIPEDIIDNDDSAEVIRNNGFKLYLKSSLAAEDLEKLINKVSCIEHIEIVPIDEDKIKAQDKKQSLNVKSINTVSNVISVNVQKVDKLMDLLGELVVSESMVTGNSDLLGLQLENFNKSARQLRKIINDLQDVVMAIRMIPIAPTFIKMKRLVRDMCNNLSKDVELELIGEDTEVDKSIIENISDPIMHLIRNSMDHGIEKPGERLALGKNEKGKITLEAKNEGGDVYIIVKDDGRGLDREKIYKKAFESGLTEKSIDEITDKEIYSFIMLPGFSTNDTVNEYSGRGVGMDVVSKNIDKIRGTVFVDSKRNQGTVVTMKIPLTLAIIDGMQIKVGNTTYTIPIISIKRSFKLASKDLLIDPDGNEMVMVRGKCYPLIRLYTLFNEDTKIQSPMDGIIVMVENDGKVICLLADELLGQQQVVIKGLPGYIKKIRGISGCTLLGNGSISLILDVSAIIN